MPVGKGLTCSKTTTGKRKPRKRNIIWYNPPYNMNVKTKPGRKFFQILEYSFPKTHQLHTIFNRNTVKLSYSCMPNMKNIIQANNNKIMREYKNNNRSTTATDRKCNLRNATNCPLNGECLKAEVIYQAKVTTAASEETYVGLTANTFKQRYNNHMSSFRNSEKRLATELSKHVWQLKDNNTNFNITWQIITQAKAANNQNQRTCGLCLAEKFYILYHPSMCSLNKRTEIFSACRHGTKFRLGNHVT